MTEAEIVERSGWDFFWLPDDVRVIDRPELAYVASERKDPVFNHVARVRATDEQLPALIAEVVTAHRVRSRWTVPDTTDTAQLERLLVASGYRQGDIHDVCVISTANVRPETGARIQVERVQTAAALRDLHAVTRSAFGKDDEEVDDGDISDELAICHHAEGRVHRFLARLDGEPVCSGGMTCFDDLGFGVLWAGGTVPGARGRGAYRAVVSARIAWARRRGLGLVGVNARQGSSAPILRAHGFRRCGEMTYWDRG